MPPSLKNDHDTNTNDDELNPYNRRGYDPSALNQAEQSAFDDIADNYNQDADPAEEDANVNRAAGINDMESMPRGGWQTNVDPKLGGLNAQNYANKGINQALAGANPASRVALQVLGRIKKNGGPLGAVAGLLIIIMVGFWLLSLNPAVFLMQNLTDSNDVAGSAMQRRFAKAFGYATSPDNAMCQSKNLSCKMGPISNSAIRKLDKKGIVAYADADRNIYKGGRTGYPPANPVGWGFPDGVDDKGATKYKYVPSGDVEKFLLAKENRKFASKVFGPTGAFNMRVRAYLGKPMTKNFFNKFGLQRDGGAADGKNTSTASTEDRAKAAQEKRRAAVPTAASLEGRMSDTSNLIKDELGRAQRGGVVYMGAVGGCILPKAPKYFAAGAAAIQVAQLMSSAEHSLLSPGAKIQASGLDERYSVSELDVETTNVALTEQVTRESDGKKSTALDSRYLRFAAGVDDGRPPMSKAFTPGYAVLTHSLVRTGAKVERSSKEACDFVLHPNTMYAAMTADAATTIAASATIIGGVVKVAASWVISTVALEVTKSVANTAGKEVLKDLVKNDRIPQARGEELGDVIGIGATAYFASAGVARYLPAMTTSQLQSANAVHQETIAMWGEMEAASLSPFDTSSKYTALGSIAHSINSRLLPTSGGLNSLLALMPSPASIFGAKAYATSGMEERCSYEAFDQANLFANPDSTETVSRNMAGMYCPGLTPEQARMSTDAAMRQLTVTDKWVDDTIEIQDGTDVPGLIASGVIKKDNPLYDFVEQCGDASTGAFVYNGEQCTVSPRSGQPMDGGCVVIDGIETCPEEGEGEVNIGGINSGTSTVAMTPLLLDYQIITEMNGEFDEDPS